MPRLSCRTLRPDHDGGCAKPSHPVHSYDPVIRRNWKLLRLLYRVRLHKDDMRPYVVQEVQKIFQLSSLPQRLPSRTCHPHRVCICRPLKLRCAFPSLPPEDATGAPKRRRWLHRSLPSHATSCNYYSFTRGCNVFLPRPDSRLKAIGLRKASLVGRGRSRAVSPIAMQLAGTPRTLRPWTSLTAGSLGLGLRALGAARKIRAGERVAGT